MPIELSQDYVMTETIFLQHYADDRLVQFWQARDIHSATNQSFLALLNTLYQTPLWQLDQYTVGQYTGQADGLNDVPRLVFAIKNLGSNDACDNSMVINIPLYRRRVTFSAIVSMQPGHGADRTSWTCELKDLCNLLARSEVREHLRNLVSALKGRCMAANAQRQPGNRQPNVPRQYQPPLAAA